MSEDAAQPAEHGVEIGAVLVFAGHEDHAWQAERRALAPRALGADFDPVDGTGHDHGEIGNRQCGVHIGHEIGISGGVDQVDLVGVAVRRLPLERRDRQRDRHPAGDLLRLGVGDRVAVFDRAGPRRDAGTVQQRLGQRRLAHAAVPHQCDVADPVGRVLLHSTSGFVRLVPLPDSSEPGGARNQAVNPCCS